MNDRFRLVSDYLDELWDIKGLPHQMSEDKMKYFREVTGDKNTQWIDIKDGKQLIGFLLVGTPPNCHPDSDYYIEEAYIKPEYRRKKYMSAVVSEFIQHHKGVYCLFVLDKNDGALNFWKKIFAKLGYRPCILCDVGAGDEYCMQYGFEPVS